MSWIKEHAKLLILLAFIIFATWIIVTAPNHRGGTPRTPEEQQALEQLEVNQE